MWAACTNFVEAGSRTAFEELQTQLLVSRGSIPVVATFPAFMRPDRFPMVDRWIANWVVEYLKEYPGEAGGLVPPSESFLRGKRTTLTVPADWPFYASWTEWCRAAARILADCTGSLWRARDVEMVAFANARSGLPILPAIKR